MVKGSSDLETRQSRVNGKSSYGGVGGQKPGCLI